jgi:hypothetical protein
MRQRRGWGVLRARKRSSERIAIAFIRRTVTAQFQCQPFYNLNRVRLMVQASRTGLRTAHCRGALGESGGTCGGKTYCRSDSQKERTSFWIISRGGVCRESTWKGRELKPEFDADVP